MGILKQIIGAATIVLAGAAVAGKVSRDKKKKAELEEFLVPEQDDSIEVDIPVTGDRELKKAISVLENQDPKTEYFTFYVNDAESAHKFQSMAADLEMGSSYNSGANTVEVEYKGNFDRDDLDLLYIQLTELCRQCDATFKSSHE